MGELYLWMDKTLIKQIKKAKDGNEKKIELAYIY